MNIPDHIDLRIITQDIESGVRNNPSFCPVALCIKRTLNIEEQGIVGVTPGFESSVAPHRPRQ